ncbi:hypothetical protein OB919_10250 [Halobacteria archaeon AArc-curdl1]|uniref:YNCE-like beta-propeller domain-containing protein n=1 Tax=Natronosalvus hydrolyticus TaxID=2979988 RepID=A0AAP2Z8S4_9EURY|nr:hypothetical protein [Halobacteria archaeon AArc-curdl1]
MIDTVDVADRTSHGVAAHPDGDELYVSDAGNGHIYVVSTSDFEKSETIDVDMHVHGLDVTPNGRQLYVSGDHSEDDGHGEGDDHDHDHDQEDDHEGISGEGELAVIDTEDYDVLDRIETEGSGHTYFGSGDRAYTTMYHFGERHQNTNAFGVIDREGLTMSMTVPVSDGVVNVMATAEEDDVVYCGSRMANSVSVIDTKRWVEEQRFSTGAETHGLAVSPDGEHLWTANRGSNDVRVIDRETGGIVETIDSGGDNHLSFSPDTHDAYVTSIESNEVIVIDSESYEIEGRIDVGSQPHELVFGT